MDLNFLTVFVYTKKLHVTFADKWYVESRWKAPQKGLNVYKDNGKHYFRFLVLFIFVSFKHELISIFNLNFVLEFKWASWCMAQNTIEGKIYFKMRRINSGKCIFVKWCYFILLFVGSPYFVNRLFIACYWSLILHYWFKYEFNQNGHVILYLISLFKSMYDYTCRR